jgi:esterase/lipase superfamily enzyme
MVLGDILNINAVQDVGIDFLPVVFWWPSDGSRLISFQGDGYGSMI